MKVVYHPNDTDIANLRKRAYLKQWPVELQLEALTEASNGHPEKLEKLKNDIMAIKKLYPKEVK